MGFYFLNNCTAWSVFRGFHENDESLISTKQQLWGNKVIHFEPVHSWVTRDNRNRKQKQEARVKMAIWNSTVFKIAAGNEKEFLMPQSLITFMCQILQQIHITLKWLMVQQFPNIGICFIQYTAAIIFAGIMCCLAVIIYNPFIHRGYTNAYFFFLRLKAYRECVARPIMYIHARYVRIHSFLNKKKPDFSGKHVNMMVLMQFNLTYNENKQTNKRKQPLSKRHCVYGDLFVL